jgi:hypothetical protein
LGRRQRLAKTAGVAVIAALALPAAAQAAQCPQVPTTQAFAAYGDANQYFVAPGGTFEGFIGWTKQGRAELVDGFNLFSGGGPLGSSAAELSKDEGVTSMSFCVDRTMPHLRFVARYDSGGQLDVSVTTRYAGSVDTSSGSVSPDDHIGWQPSRYVELKTGSIPYGESGVATVTFKSQGRWRVDDVAVDPYRR